MTALVAVFPMLLASPASAASTDSHQLWLQSMGLSSPEELEALPSVDLTESASFGVLSGSGAMRSVCSASDIGKTAISFATTFRAVATMGLPTCALLPTRRSIC